MKVTSKSRRSYLLQNIIFVVLFLGLIGLLAWLSTRYVYQADWTASGRNTLSPASVALLAELKKPVNITAFSTNTGLLRKRISGLVGRYQRHKTDISLVFINPEQEPQRVRELGITMDGEMLLEYAGRTEQLRDITERGLTNALQRVARGGERQIVFVTGHGERSIDGQANYDLAAWARRLATKGFNVHSQNLASEPHLGSDVTILVIASPTADLLQGEVVIIQDYIKSGGNLLWLTDPENNAAIKTYGLGPLAVKLGIQFQPGIIVDPNISQVGMLLFGIDDPRVALVASYPHHPIVANFDFNTLFPLARGIELVENSEWQGQAFLETLSNTWSETEQASGEVMFDPVKDISGPLAIGVALTKQQQPDRGSANDDAIQSQRIVVIGDGDFLSSGSIGGGGNLQLGMNIINWLSRDDNLISIPAKTSHDQSLELTDVKIAIIGFGFLIAMPLGLLGTGFVIWYRRRRR